jgi:tetratricopeptide (TPR) repeat protein
MRKVAVLLLALCLGLALLELRLRTVQGIPLPASGSDDSFRVLALGDSITRGTDGEGGSYPRELQQLLWQAKVKAKVEVINAGVPGLETFELSRSVGETLDRFRPHVVITMIGNADITLRERSMLERLRVFRLFHLVKGMLARAGTKDAENTDDSLAYTRSFGAVLRGEKRYKEAIQAHLEVLKLHPAHQMAHIELGQICREMGKFDLAESYYLKAIELGKKSDDPLKRYSWAYVLLMNLFDETRQAAKADELAARIEKEFAPSYMPFEYLADYYRKRKNDEGVNRVLAASVVAKPHSARLHLLWALRLKELGRSDEARAETLLAQKTEQSGELRELTGDSYRRLSEEIRARGILHLAMQYPRRDLADLEAMLGRESPGLRFVDNGPNFADALARKKYVDYFTDDFGGNFGHMTPAGNRLVAESVMKTLLPWLREKKLID